MDGAQTCADKEIGKFVQSLGPPYGPNWAGLIPGDTTNGWNASKADWRAQADGIMDAFETCVGVKIARVQSEIDALRSQTLSVFSDYLVEKALLSAAKLRFRMAAAHLADVKGAIKTFTPR